MSVEKNAFFLPGIPVVKEDEEWGRVIFSYVCEFVYQCRLEGAPQQMLHSRALRLLFFFSYVPLLLVVCSLLLHTFYY